MTPFSLYARAMLAYSIHEHQEGHVTRINAWLTPRSFVIQDDGRGMGLHREDYVTNLMGTICDTHGPVQLHGVALSIIAASSPNVEIAARRDGKLWKQSFAWGVANGPPQSEPAGTESGTRTAVVAAADAEDLDVRDVVAQIEVWRAMYPLLAIHVH